MITRRGVIKTMSAGAGGVLLAGSAAADAQPADRAKEQGPAPKKSAGRVDVQFHYAPKFYTDRVKEVGGHITTDAWSVPAALDYMDRYQVATGIMSVSTPSVLFVDPAEGVTLARKLNDSAAQIARDHPGRFGNFATLPMLDVAATLKEIDYCFDVLKMEGVCMMSNIGGLYPGHPSFAPIFDALNHRKAVIFIHPHDPAYYNKGVVKMAQVVEWPFDTSRAAIDLMYSGTIKRCPDIKIILAHAGGALPMVARRVEEMAFVYSQKAPPTAATPNAGPMAKQGMDDTIASIAKFYYDLAISAHDNAIGALREVSDMNHVLFACDWPFAPDPAVRMNVAGFEQLKISDVERYAIERGNAERLFPALVKS